MKPLVLLLFFTLFLLLHYSSAIQILSKSRLQKCEKVSESNSLNCTNKIIIDLAVPSESSGNEASLVAEIVEVEENSSSNMRTLRVPPVITINKSAAYALYELTYIRDIAYKPQEFYVNTRKCQPDAGADVVQICERLRDENGHIIENTQPTCCPCGDQRRVPSSCGNFFDKMTKGKKNTAHCLRFPDDWFHVFSIGQRSVGFSIRIDVKKQSQNSEVIVGPDNRTATSSDNFLRVNLIGDYVGYTDIPSFDDLYLVIPRQGGPGQPQNLGSNFSMWMLLERVRFTLDGVECNKVGVGYDAFNAQPDFCSAPFWSCLHNQLWNFWDIDGVECNKIGVGYDAFNAQPDFCSAPFWSCLHNQLWNFWDADQNRISRNQVPLYCVQGRFERINQHPVTFQNAGSHAFSIGITEVLNTNLLIELNADDIEYVYQRSPGKILSITIPTFEALTQFGTATITTKNIGEVEASYSLTFDCSAGVSQMEEQFYIMKPNEVMTRGFKLYPASDQAAKYVCSAILKDSDFNEVDRAECQFTTKATVLDNGSQKLLLPHQYYLPGSDEVSVLFPNYPKTISLGSKFLNHSSETSLIPFQPPKTNINGFFGSIEDLWKKTWENLTDFLTGKSCRMKCYGFFDFSCHIQNICISWVVMFCLFLAIIPTVIVLLWLLHQKGLFDPLYDWWEDHFSITEDKHMSRRKHNYDADPLRNHHKRSHKNEPRHHKHHRRHTRFHNDPRENLLGEADYHYYLHHVHKDKHKHGKTKSSGITKPLRSRKGEDDHVRHHRRTNEGETLGGPIINKKRGDENQEEYLRHKHPILNDTHHKRQSKWKE